MQETLKSPIEWTEVLNEEAVWHDYEDFITWFRSVARNLVVPPPEAFLKFRRDMRFIREQAACLYFGNPSDLVSINQRLRDVSLAIDLDAVAQTRLPALLGTRGDLLERLYAALLVDFSRFIAMQVAAGTADVPRLSRCQGVYRDERADVNSLNQFERSYRQEIPIIDENELLDDPAIQRCYDFFVGRPKARFCSDACRFTTFQINKQYKDPGYLAEKQRRYRKKLQS